MSTKDNKLAEELVKKDDIQYHLLFLDIHLDLLHNAMMEKDKEGIEFQTAQLKNIHRRLGNTGYFTDNDRVATV